MGKAKTRILTCREQKNMWRKHPWTNSYVLLHVQYALNTSLRNLNAQKNSPHVFPSHGSVCVCVCEYVSQHVHTAACSTTTHTHIVMGSWPLSSRDQDEQRPHSHSSTWSRRHQHSSQETWCKWDICHPHHHQTPRSHVLRGAPR